MPKCAVVTGSTGAIGPMLVEELLRSGEVGELTLLARSNPDELPGMAGRAPVTRYQADLRADGLGLRPADFDRVTRRADVIVHAAADTRFRSPAVEQWNTNVGGTQRMLDLARRCESLKKFIFISTVCVSGTATGLIAETHPETAPGFVNEYERTKFEAETLVLNSQLPVEIVRLSIVIGSHAGTVHRPGAIHHMLRWFARGLVPRVPGTPDSTLDLIATETATRFIARVATTPTAPGAIYHVAAGEQAAKLVELRAWATEQLLGPGCSAARAVQFVDEETFDRFRATQQGSNRLISQAAESIKSFAPTLLYPRIYDTRRAQQLWGGPLPLFDWRTTLQRVMRQGRLGGGGAPPGRVAAA